MKKQPHTYVIRAAALLTPLAFNFAACAVVDQYAPRAMTYNAQANNSRTELVLLNIIRAAYRKPLQFSEVGSVTGIASAGGTLGATVPVVGVGSLLSPQLTASGGPNFSFSNLSTQEFYQASSAEVDTATISLMLNQGFSPQVVFPLLISDITINDGRSVRRVRMDVDNERQFFSSFTAVTGLLKQGLTARPSGSESQLGPPLARSEAKDAAFNILRGQDISKEPNLKKNDNGSYSLIKSVNKIVLCFDPTLFEQNNEAQTNFSNKIIVPLTGRRQVYVAVKNGRADPNFTITLPDEYRCGIEKPEKAKSSRREPAKGAISLTFRMRSLQGVYEYLGSLARIELGLDGPASSLAIEGESQDTFLLKVRKGPANPGGLTTSTEFGDFSIEPDPTGYDLSFQAVKAITFLQALNSKATTLVPPVATSVLVR